MKLGMWIAGTVAAGLTFASLGAQAAPVSAAGSAGWGPVVQDVQFLFFDDEPPPPPPVYYGPPPRAYYPPPPPPAYYGPPPRYGYRRAPPPPGYYYDKEAAKDYVKDYRRNQKEIQKERVRTWNKTHGF
ncbi:hypothetical protein [Microvirga flavescens]|uniref:hypothetical protein n=1 Tax=Microvirga flavescens TaxID=2249811 RepID=UPI000DDBC923|nr:hypothetical protein [Microvirga flavescens]